MVEISLEVKNFLTATLVPPQPHVQKFLLVRDFLNPKPPLSALGQQNHRTPAPPCDPPPAQKFRKLLQRLPLLPWSGVANHTPPILKLTHGAPGSQPSNPVLPPFGPQTHSNPLPH